MNHLAALLLILLAFSFSGCGVFNSDDSKDDEIVQSADTANADVAPVTDGKSPEGTSTSSDAQAASSSGGGAAAETSGTLAPTKAGEFQEYPVKQGDTLMKVAFDLYGDIGRWKSLYDWNVNKLKNANRLAVGMTLKYEAPATAPSIDKNGDPYLIKKGDTLGTIAFDLYGTKTKWKKLYENNRKLIKNPNRIYAGFYLYYQISEEEHLAAEKAKANRVGGNTEMPATGTAPASEAPPSPTPTPDSSAPSSGGGGDAAPVESGGLNSLATPQGNSNRAPASTK